MSSEALNIARRYFELSNARKLDEVETLFTDTAAYISANTGSFTGKREIMEMMRAFFAGFQKLHWDIQSEEEIDSNTARFDFTLTGLKSDGEKVKRKGLESITVIDGKIERVEIRNKPE